MLDFINRVDKVIWTRKEIRVLTFRALALRHSESRNCGLYIVYIKLNEGVVMKPRHKNNGVAIYVGRAATVHNPLF